VTSLAQARADVVARLRAAGVPSPEVDARWLVEAASGSDPRRTPDGLVDADTQRRLSELVARRCAREPLQLVLGTTAFHDLELQCRPGVFVPRPETEVLADIALELVRARATERARDADAAGPVVLLEPCCGTGAVGLAVACSTADAVVTIADRSPVATALAAQNRAALEAAGRLRCPVEVRSGSLMDAFDPAVRGHVDVLVANPPYLPLSDLALLEPEVAWHDPHEALFGGPEGHEIVDGLLDLAAEWLAPGGAIVLEVDARRCAEAVAHARRVGLVDVGSRRDLTGADRFVLARRPGP